MGSIPPGSVNLFETLGFPNPTVRPQIASERAAHGLNRAVESGGLKNFLTTEGGDEVDDANLVFQRTFQRLAVALEFEQLRAQISNGEEPEDGENTGATFQAQQLSFSFFFEAQSEEIALFRERTDKVADGQEGERRERFLATRERIAVRFEFNAEITTAALNGFAGTAEEAADDPDAVDSLVDTADNALGEDADFFNQLFGLFDEFLNSEGDIEERFAALLAGLEELGLIAPGLGALPGSSGESDDAGDAGGTTFTARSTWVSFQFEFEFISEELKVKESDPIVLDLDDDGVELSNYNNGAAFDITGNGDALRTAFVNGGDAFLALDRNSNGRIDNGTELFGDQRGAKNGFEELARLDNNNDGVIDERDPIYDLLKLFRDDGDGQTEEGELIGLREAGVASIYLRYRDVNHAAAGGNRIGQIAAFTRTDGTRGTAADAILNYIA